jgi:SAM-dependent methyltransferase
MQSPNAANAEQAPSSDESFRARQARYTQQRQCYWDEFAASLDRWERTRGYYQRRLAEIYQFLVPPGVRVLELGCGQGDLLARLRPAYGVGVDLSPALIERARARHPDLAFVQADAHWLALDEKFDVIVCSDLMNELWDVQQVLRVAAAHGHAGTRLILNIYNRLWELPRRLAEWLGLARPMLEQNWLTVKDLANLLYLNEFEVVRTSREILWPLRTPVLDWLANRYLVKLWPWCWLGLTNFIVARPKPVPGGGAEPGVSVVVPARNEAGNIPHIFNRLPNMGGGTELIFVEGHSSDYTGAVIEREMANWPGRCVKLLRQAGKGKGDAVRLGFANATGELLMILDADLTVAPEDLPRFYEAWRSGKGELVNGVRLVYPMGRGAMRLPNLLGNKFLSRAFSWLLGQSIKDTLCGAKALSRHHYETIAANRSYFGKLDPFGDFDLIFGAARYSLKMVDLPIRYQERTYGKTSIRRWRHGLLLLRMVLLASRRIKFV